jgi:hypothetical protein
MLSSILRTTEAQRRKGREEKTRGVQTAGPELCPPFLLSNFSLPFSSLCLGVSVVSLLLFHREFHAALERHDPRIGSFQVVAEHPAEPVDCRRQCGAGLDLIHQAEQDRPEE